MAFVSNRDGIPRIWLKQLASGSEVPLTDGPDDMPRFSPDGSQILFVHDEDAAHLYRTAVSAARPARSWTTCVEADWSPDGNQVAFLRITATDDEQRGQHRHRRVQTGPNAILHSLENRLWYGLRWSPDGRRLSITEASLTGNVAVVASLT